MEQEVLELMKDFAELMKLPNDVDRWMNFRTQSIRVPANLNVDTIMISVDDYITYQVGIDWAKILFENDEEIEVIYEGGS